MNWVSFFEHPDFCWPVIRRRTCDRILELFAGYLDMATRRGVALTWSHAFPRRDSFRSAAYRLRKKGLIVTKGVGDGAVSLALAPAASDRLSPVHKPGRIWKRGWAGDWFLLVYDVPEANQTYRNELRGFLRRMRMGRFQKSVWVSPWDIRPEFDDLVNAAGIRRYAELFRSRSVLGRSPLDIVEASWDMEDLHQAQSWFIGVCRRNLDILLSQRLDKADLEMLAREEMSAYVQVMEMDPLLPEELHPASYLGQDVVNIHQTLIREVGSQL